jgi:hypothetical protein
MFRSGATVLFRGLAFIEEFKVPQNQRDRLIARAVGLNLSNGNANLLCHLVTKHWTLGQHENRPAACGR